jgi:fatty acid desaturase
MLGPLPRLYRSFVITTVLLLGIASGAWIAYMTALPLAATMGAAFGAAAAVLIAFVVVHDFSHQSQHARITRRR